jgi:hypothetical protein
MYWQPARQANVLLWQIALFGQLAPYLAQQQAQQQAQQGGQSGGLSQQQLFQLQLQQLQTVRAHLRHDKGHAAASGHPLPALSSSMTLGSPCQRSMLYRLADAAAGRAAAACSQIRQQGQLRLCVQVWRALDSCLYAENVMARALCCQQIAPNRGSRSGMNRELPRLLGGTPTVETLIASLRWFLWTRRHQAAEQRRRNRINER